MSEGPARLRRISSAIRSEAFSRAEIADHLGGVAVLAVDRLVHRAHVVGGDFPARASRAVLICGQRWRASSRTSGTAW